MSTQPFLRQRAAAQSAGIAIIRNILTKNSFPDGVTTRELYKIAIQEPPPENFTPFPVNVTGPAPTEIKRPKGKSPSNANIRVLLSNRPEHPEHPVRSIRFLKEYILPHLQGNHEITMSYTHKAADPNAATTKKARLAASRHNWFWKVIPPEERPIPPAPPKAKNVVGTEVGVGEDVSHLNRRRTRARVAKVSKQVKHMKNYKAYAAERDSLLSKIEKNPYTLKKVSKALHDNPDADVSYLSVSEEIARQNLPKQFWQDQPIEGEKAQTRLKHIRKHLAWRQPDILNR